MIFGKDRNKGLVLDGWNLKAVTIGENGITEKNILVHDVTTEDPTLHLKLAMMEGPDMPIAMGVIRAVKAETYNDAVCNQIADVQNNTTVKKFEDLYSILDTWEIN
jgi:2-oxoglutarate ferredoxin oxidoreductase subunit beta